MGSPRLCVTKMAKVDCPIVCDETGFTLKRLLSQIDSFKFVSEIQDIKGVSLTVLTASANRYGDLRAAILLGCRTGYLQRVKRYLVQEKCPMFMGTIFLLLTLVAKCSAAFLTIMPTTDHLPASGATFLRLDCTRDGLFGDDSKQVLTMSRRVGI